MITENFIPYEESIALKQLGFNEECLCSMYTDIPFNKTAGNPIKTLRIGCGDKDTDAINISETQKFANSNYADYFIAVPLYQQAFKFFREKYEFYPHFFSKENGSFVWCIRWYVTEVQQDTPYLEARTYEEAELACLRKLIEIAKQSK